jgi:hypothetical protein
MYARKRTFAALAIAAVLLGALALATVAFGKTTTLRASLSGSVEVPKGAPSGSGKATITLDSAKGKVCWSFKSLKGVAGPNAAHIHTGKAGKAGAVVVPLGGKFKTSGCQSGVSKSLIGKIAKSPGSYYVNIHNAKYPAGAVRGQLHK